MNRLLREVLAAHGSIERSERYENVSATIVSGGDLFDAKGIKEDTTPRKVSTATKSERMTATPFGNPEWKMTFVPDRVVIEDGKGVVVAERSNPRDAFAGHSYETPWDPVHSAYFSGYALWTYLNTPFFLAMPEFAIEEIAHPELFEVAREYEFGDFQKAIQHVSRPGKTGIILLKSPVQEG